jgi:ABC-type multidrug transport system permease subunit
MGGHSPKATAKGPVGNARINRGNREERTCAAWARPWQLIVSKICPYLAVNAVQAALMLAVGVWLMPRIGGEGLSLQGVNWAAMLLILLAISLAQAVGSTATRRRQPWAPFSTC